MHFTRAHASNVVPSSRPPRDALLLPRSRGYKLTRVITLAFSRLSLSTWVVATAALRAALLVQGCGLTIGAPLRRMTLSLKRTGRQAHTQGDSTQAQTHASSQTSQRRLAVY